MDPHSPKHAAWNYLEDSNLLGCVDGLSGEWFLTHHLQGSNNFQSVTNHSPQKTVSHPPRHCSDNLNSCKKVPSCNSISGISYFFFSCLQLPPWWYGYVVGGVLPLDVMRPVAVVLLHCYLSGCLRLMCRYWTFAPGLTAWCTQQRTSYQYDPLQAHQLHPSELIWLGCTSPSFPRSCLPSLPSHVLWSNLYPVSKHHPRFLSLPFISCTNYSQLQDQLAVSYPSHPQPCSYPLQFSLLYLISLQILFTSLTLPKSVRLVPMPQFTVYCHFFNCLPCLSVT